LISGLGREDCGFFEFKGIPLNSYESNIQRVIKNDEFRGLAEILGIKWSETFQICTYDEIIISTDADLDGFHIRGLLLGFIKKYAPNYFTENRVKIFESPYMLIKNKDRIESVIFDANECKATFKGKTIKILKGLGSWNENEFDQMIEKYSLDYFIIPVELDDEGYKYLDDWLISDNINQRKEQIQAYDFDINLV
jgi:topoisomerase-4 subunit B